MGLRDLLKVIDVRITEWWRHAGVVERTLLIGSVLIGWACVLVGVWISAFAAYLHYLIRTGQFID